VVTVFIHNLLKILKFKTVLIYLLLVEGGTTLSFFTTRYLWSQGFLSSRFSSSTFVFFLNIGFYWILGLPLLIFHYCRGIGLILEERKEGTLLLLVSKPIARYKLILGKWLALVFSALLLGFGNILIAGGLITYFIWPDFEAICHLVELVPFFTLFILFIACCLPAIAVSLPFFICSKRILNIRIVLLSLLFYLVNPFWNSFTRRQLGMDYLIIAENINGMIEFISSANVFIPIIVCIFAGSILFLLAAIRKFDHMDIY